MFIKYSSMITFLITLSLSFNNSLSGFNTSNLSYNNDITTTHENSSEIQKEICFDSLQILQKNVLAVLDKLYSYLDYWQKAQYRPIGYFIEKGPYRWLFGKNQKTEISDALELINFEIIRNAYYLGLVHELEINLEKAPPHNLDKQVRAIACKMKSILHFAELEEISNGTGSSKKDLDTLLAKNQKMAKSYKKRALRLFISAQMPGHLQRHWLGYGVTTICSLVGLGYYFKNKDYLTKLIEEGKIASTNFYTDYIAIPIKKSLDIIYRKKEDKPLITQADIKIDKDLYRKELSDYYKDKYPKKNEQFTSLINKAVDSNSLPEEIMNDYAEQIKNPTWNFISPNGQIARLFLISQFQPFKMKVNEGFLKIDQLFKANELNFELLVALPATAIVGLACYLSYKGLQKAYQSFLTKKELLYKPIKQGLITIETILNTYINESPSYAVNGQLLYWHHKLSQAAALIPLASRAKFERDLAELVSSHFDIPQKLNTVQRMFRAYEFLN